MGNHDRQEDLQRIEAALTEGGEILLRTKGQAYSGAEFEAIDARAYHFARQFPLWHIFELSAETADRAS